MVSEVGEEGLAFRDVVGLVAKLATRCSAAAV
jgi:hypothetical protein